MKFALLRCCTTPIYLEQYESSTDAVLEKLGVEFVDIKAFNCCGYPLKNSNFKAYVLSSARNLALAEKRDLHMMTFCNCCYISEKNVSRLMKEDPSTKDEVNKTLEKEGLRYEGRTEVRHLLDILYQDIGIDLLNGISRIPSIHPWHLEIDKSHVIRPALQEGQSLVTI